jgi:glycosyltransferase involved in cell wall biosynthesis
VRIVYLHQYFTTPEMSGGTRSYEFARRLVAAGHEVHMITSDRTRGGKPYESVEAGIRVTWIPVSYSNHLGTFARIRAFVEFAVKSARYAASTPADVVFATSTPLTIALPGIYAKWRQRVPMVFEVRDLWPEMPIALGVLKDPVSKWLARWLEHFTYHKSQHIIALSPGMKAGVASAGFPPQQITVIPNAADIDCFDVHSKRGDEFRVRFNWLENRKLVVYTGTLGVLNGVGYLAKVAAEMEKLDPEIRFLVVGSGKDEAKVRQQARALGVYERNFFMLPRIPKSDVPDVLSAADVTTSLFIDVKEMWSNSANKFFDGLAAGRPVAINYGGWHADILQSHNAGVVLHPIDHADAAKSLFEFLSDNGCLRAASENARTLAAAQFARDDHAARLIQILTTVAQSGRNGT